LTSLGFASLRAPLARRLRPKPPVGSEGESGTRSKGRAGARSPSRSIPCRRACWLHLARGRL